MLKPVFISLFFSPATVLCFCSKSSAVSTKPLGISLLPPLSNDIQSLLGSHPSKFGNSSQQINTDRVNDPGKMFGIYGFTHIQSRVSLTHLYILYTLKWPILVWVLVLSSLFQKTTETRAGSFRASQSETLPCWSLVVISYQLLSIAAISHEPRIKAQLWQHKSCLCGSRQIPSLKYLKYIL